MDWCSDVLVSDLAGVSVFCSSRRRHTRCALVLEFRRGSSDLLAVAGVLRLLRRQGADVAGAHLAAGCPCRGTDGRLGDPGRRAAEDGRLRVPAVLDPDVPRGVRHLRAAGLCAQRGGGDLNLARSEEHTSELPSLMRISYDVFCMK